MAKVEPIENGYIQLAAAIIKAGVCDYVTARRRLLANPEDGYAITMYYKNYQFFKSEWFKVLSLGTNSDWMFAELERIVQSDMDVRNFTLDLRSNKKLKSAKGGLTWENTKTSRGV